MSTLSHRTLTGVGGAMLITIASAATSVWEPLAWLTGPGCLAIGAFFWLLSRIVTGAGLKILRVGWPTLGLLVIGDQLGVPGLALPIVAGATAIAGGNLAVTLQPSRYPRPVWVGSLISIVIPVLIITAATVYVVGSSTVGGVARSSGVGFLVAVTGLFTAHGVGVAISAFGTDRVVANRQTSDPV